MNKAQTIQSQHNNYIFQKPPLLKLHDRNPNKLKALQESSTFPCYECNDQERIRIMCHVCGGLGKVTGRDPFVKCVNHILEAHLRTKSGQRKKINNSIPIGKQSVPPWNSQSQLLLNKNITSSFVLWHKIVTSKNINQRATINQTNHSPQTKMLPINASWIGPRISQAEENNGDDDCLHYKYRCNGCQKDEPIAGWRYRCLTCLDYDLCHFCFSKREHRHEFQRHQAPKSERILAVRNFMHLMLQN